MTERSAEQLREEVAVALTWVPPKYQAGAFAALDELRALAATVLPDDTVCACLSETGERKVRLYERCQRCGAFMEADDMWGDAA